MTPELEAEVTTGPLAAELAPYLAAGDLAPAAAILNRRDIAVTRAAPARKAKSVLLVHGLWAGIKAAAADPQHPAYGYALTAYEIGHDPGGEFDFAGATAAPILDGLEAGGLITPAASAEIVALCTTTTSRAEQVFGRQIDWRELT